MTKRKTSKKKRSPAQEAVHQAAMITGQIAGKLKCERINYLKVGELLAKVRDEKMFTPLHHTNIEDYAEKRLRLRKTSLYQYLRAYDWAKKYHPAWLQPKPKGFIPELNDVADLAWMDEELERKDLTAEARKELGALKTKALNGELRQTDIEKWKTKGGRAANGLKSFLSKIRFLRKRGAVLTDMPADVIKLLDNAIEIVRILLAEKKDK